MSETQKKFYLTTPIYYVNARPHIGHAYTTIAADVIARRHRLLGDDTFFLTGTDEHGQKIERSATAAGIPPQQFADQVSAQFESLWKRMGILGDSFSKNDPLFHRDYIRTTEPRHKKGVQKLFTLLQQNGFIELRAYTGQYCISDETFVDVPVGAPCPECGRITETVTEENYFFRLSYFQRQLIDLIESDTLAIQPDSRKNEVLSFLRGNVSAQTAAQSSGAPSLPESHPGKGGNDHAQPAIAHSAKGTPYLPGALKDLSISRSSFKWGIPVPGDEKHVIYVWLDALANYMTAVGYGSDDPADQVRFEKYWPADLHLVGKEIIRFHCVYWPAFLLAAGLPLPKAITAHGWLLFEESKMSKSRGNIVRTETILDAFGTLCPPTLLSSRSEAEGSASPEPPHPPTKAEQDLFAADVLRYFLLREIPFGQDGSFSFDALVQRYNSDLANGYGNLVSRVLKMIEQYCSGQVPSTSEIRSLDKTKLPEWWTSDPFVTDAKFTDLSSSDPFLSHGYVTIRDARGQVGLSIDSELKVHGGKYFYSVNEGLNISEFFQVAIDPLIRATLASDRPENLTRFINLVMMNIKIVDEFLSVSKPWKLPSDDPRRNEILGVSAACVRIITLGLYPILPYATAKVWAQLGLGDIEEAARNGRLKNLEWGGLKPGTKLGPLSPIFPRADKGLIQIMTDMEQNNAPAPSKLVDEKTATQPIAQDPTHPAAGPRTSALDEPNPGAQVGGAAAPHPDLVKTPPHSEAAASGPFAASAAGTSTPDTPQISIDDFVKIDLRVARIVIAERIPKADKLLRLEVDLGYEKRQILSGIAEWYTPEELIGRNIVVIANLAPRKMRGLESHGMLLAASNGENGKPILATFSEDIALGSRLR